MQKVVIILLLLPVYLFAQELFSSFSVDTNVYNDFYNTGSWYEGVSIKAVRGPLFVGTGVTFEEGLGLFDILLCYQKKGTEQFDVFSFNGKCGSIKIPSSAFPSEAHLISIFISQTYLDADADFECLVSYYFPDPNIAMPTYFKALDEDGNQILSDSGTAGYGFDGRDTYVWTITDNRTIKTWRFRTNVSYASRPLAKTNIFPGPMMACLPSGDFRVNLQPSSGGTSVQIFDMLGRQVFNKIVQNIKESMSFNIPSRDIPNSPFVARVNNQSGSFIKKEIPVR